jgi:hypothetical protein
MEKIMTVTADLPRPYGATLGVPTLKEPGEVKITKCPSCGGPQQDMLHMLLERNHDWLVVIPTLKNDGVCQLG